MRLAVALVVLCAFGATAWAQQKDPRAEAKSHYQKGNELQKQKRYAEAVGEFEAAYTLAPLPALLFNLGQANRLAGDKRKAVDWYQKYLAAEPTGAGADEARDHVATLSRQIAAEDAAAAVEAKRRAEDEAARQRAAAAEAKTHADAEAAAAAERRRAADEARAHDEALTRPGRGLRIAGVTTGVCGLILAGVGVYFAVHANSLASDVSGATGQWTDSLDDVARNQGPAAQTNAIIFTAVGAAAVATGGILYWLGTRERARAQKLGIAPQPLPRGGGLVVVGTF